MAEDVAPGIVYLVGAGPGDPGLLTLRGAECLHRADVVVHDRLVNPALLEHCPTARCIDVGKQPDHHPIPQESINTILVQEALAGQVVVRLKGGDPFVFGRGGEEALALAQAGIRFEVVPGISSAVAVPAYAGIPITHRGLACSAAIITGHRADCAQDPESDWLRAARGADTLVFLMGVRNLERIIAQVLLAGRTLDTPVAVIEQGTCPAQRTVLGTLADIASKAVDLHPPAIIVVGEVVQLAEALHWYECQDGIALPTGLE
jgi:uroporphyrinogen III methyltransferase/synthase